MRGGSDLSRCVEYEPDRTGSIAGSCAVESVWEPCAHGAAAEDCDTGACCEHC